ncbi:MAG: adenylate/guanylate cyclase domain-containing protein [Candidatus Tectomicrobia bacterium]|uniref:Adenylate/guanylate cyclase domain-containing protein n=1 Tax=Tectimicrobiota bacterium TaxID=2528274 RepID=A0A933LPT1_UNCTE|nr:adenylate/guanylate cyclase domain-containing protein [Candidatus Tectomicrobia bacterium]
MQFEGHEIKSSDQESQRVNLGKLLEKTKWLIKQMLPAKAQSVSLEKLLDERERLDELIRDRFTREITVIFTDFEGLTSVADSAGDIASRILIKRKHNIVLPIIEAGHGVLVKTMGDGTLSYFKDASDAVRAAVRIQRKINTFNLSGKSAVPIMLRIGINTGVGFVEEHDIFGDVVNVASRFESLAGPGEIFISEETFNALTDKNEFYCRYVQTTNLEGKKDLFSVFKVFWNEHEIEKDRTLVGCPTIVIPDPVSSTGQALIGNPVF